MAKHVVRAGDCIESIADAHGFYWEVVWNHPDNAALRKLRGDPVTLVPGDEVFVPPLRAKAVECATEARHTFRRKGVPSKLRVQLLDLAGRPRGGVDYALTIESDERTGSTDGDGWMDEWLPPRARKATLKIPPRGDEPEETYELEIGHLRPADDLEGIQARLRNLGWYEGPLNGELDGPTAEALQAVQAAEGLVPTGELDDDTRSRLRDAYGG
ncbi:peptidoglycan-binding protein [Sorangium sp. So ce1014]|uniref:peptidoglycan-binding protein n=1 Tax=Sorangium sp. So ce1014 TaxID=3133326 RepID=UPI003F6132CC